MIAVAKLADDTIGIGAPGPETFAVLLDACHRLGEVTYVEPCSGLIQVLVEFVDGPVCQLLLTLQGRATGVTEAFCTIESIDDRSGAADRGGHRPAGAHAHDTVT